MERKEILEKISDIILNKFNIDTEINDETNFNNDLDFDLLDFVELIIEVENIFDIMISDSTSDGIENVGQLIDVILKG